MVGPFDAIFFDNGSPKLSKAKNDYIGTEEKMIFLLTYWDHELDDRIVHSAYTEEPEAVKARDRAQADSDKIKFSLYTTLLNPDKIRIKKDMADIINE